jgi:PAS domain S-box-containing protein
MPAKILIVDDEPSARLILKNSLRTEGYTLQFAHDGAAGLAEARAWRPDVILSDVMMPVMDGLEFCRQIRADANLGQVPIVLITALNDRQAKVRGLESGADDFISKPIDPVELRARLRTLTNLDRFRKLYEERIKLDQTKDKLLQTGEALGASEERFRSFVEQSQDGFMLTDEHGIVIEWNPALARITGLAREQALGMTMWDVQTQMTGSDHPTTLEAERLKQVLGKILQTGQSPLFGQPNDAKIRALDGTVKFIQQTSFPIRTTQGYRIGAVVRDVTEHKQMEQALEAEAVRRRILFDESPDGILIIDQQTAGFIEFNTTAHKQLGYSREEFAQLHIFEIETQETADETRARIGNVIQKGKSDFETLHRTKQGELRNVHVTAQIVEIMGQPVYYCTWRDITERKRVEEARRESDARYYLLYQSMVQGVVFQDVNGHIIHANPSAEKILGLTLDQMQGCSSIDPHWHSVHEDGSAFPGQLHPAMIALHAGKPVYNQVMGVFNPASESYRWININAIPRFKDGEDKPYQVYTTFEDITERKQAEDNLRESETKYRELLNGMNDAVWVIDDDMTILDVNNAATAILGYTRQELLSMKVPDIDANLQANQIQQRVDTMPEDKVQIFETQHITKDGRVLPVEISSSLVTYKGKSVIMSIARDITERKRTEEKLRESEEQYRFLIDNTSDFIARFDQHGVLQFASGASSRFNGYSPAEIIHTSAFERQHPEDRDLARSALKRVIETGAEGKVEYRVKRKSGEYIWVEAVGRRVSSSTGEPEVIVVQRDITKRKQAEEELRISEERFATMFHSNPSAIALSRLSDNKLIDVNSAWEQTTGWSKEQAVGKTPFELDVWADPSERERMKALAGEHGTVRGFEMRLRSRSGTILNLLMSAELLTLQGESCMLSMTQDITERKLAEEKLRDSEERYRSTLENMMEGCQIISPDWRYLYVNQAVARQGLYRREELLGHTMMEMYPGIENTEMFAVLRDCMENHVMRQMENEFIYADGSHGWFNLSVVPVSEGIFILSVDVTERKRALAELDRMEKRYRALIEYAPDGIVLISADGKFKYASPSVERIFGYTQQDLPNCDAAGMTHPEDVAMVVSELTKLLNDPSYIPTIQYRLRHKSGKWRWIESTFSNLLALPSVESIIINFRDIHERKLAEESLNKSQALLKEAQRIGRMGHLEWNAQDQVLICSDEVYDIFELPKGTWLSQEIIGSMMFPEELERIKKLDLQAIEQRRDMNYEYRIRVKDGGERWIHYMGKITYGENGMPIRMMAIVQDVTERKRVEEALRVSEEKYRSLARELEERVKERTAQVQDLYDNAPVGYHSLDAESRYISVNQTELNWLGYSREELIGQPYSILSSPESRDSLACVFQQFKEVGKLNDMETYALRKDGTTFPVLINAIAIYDEQRRYVSSRMTMTDITERKKAEQALRESEARYRSIFEHSLNGILITDPQRDQVIDANPAACQMWGGSKEEFQNVGRAGLVDVTDPRLPAALNEQNRTGKFSGELNYRHKDGSSFPVEISSTINVTPIGEHVGNIFFTDITLRKQAEKTLRQANLELERALRMKDEFLATMSHELRTPLNAILGLSETLHEQILGPLNEKQTQSLVTIEASGRHLLALINDILDLSKIEAGALTLSLSSVSAKSLCDASLLFVREAAHKKNIKLFSTLDSDVQIISVDERRVKQMLVNLLSNAVKFTPEGGQIGLEMVGDRQARTVCFVVWDTGIGISEEGMARLFKPFVQLDSSLSRRYEGTGLGLSLVARMAAMHGGSVTVESKVGIGSRFTIMLPWTEAPKIDEPAHPGAAGTVMPETSPKSIATNAKAPLILIVDDNEATIFALSTYLEAKGYRLAIARNGREALAMVRVERPTLILMDLQMPDMDGLEATRSLRNDSDPGLADVPIVVLTALAMPGDREKAIAAGANEYMSKPVNLKQLVKLIDGYAKDK